MRRLTAAVLLAAVLAAAAVPVCAAEPAAAGMTEAVMEQAAGRLNGYGLFYGTGTDAHGAPVYSLDRPVTREQAAVLIVRLLGKEDEAGSRGYQCPFPDVASWARDCVGYAYQNGLAFGAGGGMYQGSREITPAEYVTLLLRVLKFVSGTDFLWSSPWSLSDGLAVTAEDWSGFSGTFTRGHAAVLASRALDACPRGLHRTLLDTILEERDPSHSGGDTPAGPAPQQPGKPALTDGSSVTGENVKRLLESLKTTYPEGLRWGSERTYTWKGDGESTEVNSCEAFALQLSDEVFGSLPARRSTIITWSKLRPGDVLRINGDTHSVIVLDVQNSVLTVAEGNSGGTVHWGRTLNRNDVTGATSVITRYPQ